MYFVDERGSEDPGDATWWQEIRNTHTGNYYIILNFNSIKFFYIICYCNAFNTVTIRLGIQVKQNGESQMFDFIFHHFTAQTDLGIS